MNAGIVKEARTIVSEGWTDGITVICGTPSSCEMVFEGKKSGNDQMELSGRIIYDLASLSKFFLLMAVLSLRDKGKIDLEEQVSRYTDSFPNLSGLKIFELMNFSRIIQSKVRIDMCDTRKDAIEVLHNSNLSQGDPKYSDMGSLVLGEIVSEIVGEKLDDYYVKLWNTWGLSETYWWSKMPVSKYDYMQSYDGEYQEREGILRQHSTPIAIVHDEKARTLYSCGHAGVYSTPYDIAYFAEGLLRNTILSANSVEALCDKKYDSYNATQHYGLLCFKKAADQKYSEIPVLCSENAIAISGFTGTFLLVDFENKIYISILSNKVFHRLTRSDKKTDHYDNIKCTSDYAFRKDKLVDICAEYLLSKQ